jgi:hypothetical protein
VLGTVATAGCGSAPTSTADTGAEAVARSYCDAVLRQDWPAAYALLHADSRARLDAAAFARQASKQRRRMGFEPDEVVLRSCEEHDGEAVAHIVYHGRADGHRHSFRDGLTLRRDPAGWKIDLPQSFGQDH